MIIKSMARKSPSFSQLISYFHKDSFYRKAPTFSHNLWQGNDPDRAVEEFEQNATFLPKRANGNYLYHECIVLGACPDVSGAKQERILLDLVQQYVALRCPDQMVYGRMHLDTDHMHFHLCISANAVRGHQRRWLSKARFADIQRHMEKYKLERYPELGTEKYYDLDARRQKRERARAEREDEAKLSQREIELKKRRGGLSQKELDRLAILEVFQSSRSEAELSQRLASLGFSRYSRGQTEGVIKTATGRKYRLKTLGLEHALLTAERRLQVYAERMADLGLREGHDAMDRDDNEREQ